MILQPFGPWRSNDSRLWHLSLSVCLEGGRAWWEGVRIKREWERQWKQRAPCLLYSSQRARHICYFSDLTRHPAARVWLFLYSSFIRVWWFYCSYEVAFRWSFFKYNRVKGSVDSAPHHHQSWLAWGGIRSFIKMTRLTFQILSFLCDIWLFILLCSSRTRESL